MFPYKTIIAPTSAAVETPVEILTTTDDAMTEYVASLAVQASGLAGAEKVVIWEGKGPTPIWEPAYVWNGPAVELISNGGSVCLEAKGVRYAVTKTATASPVGVYAVLQYEPR